MVESNAACSLQKVLHRRTTIVAAVLRPDVDRHLRMHLNIHDLHCDAAPVCAITAQRSRIRNAFPKSDFDACVRVSRIGNIACPPTAAASIRLTATRCRCKRLRDRSEPTPKEHMRALRSLVAASPLLAVACSGRAAQPTRIRISRATSPRPAPTATAPRREPGGIETPRRQAQGRHRAQDAGVQDRTRSPARSCRSSRRATPTRRSSWSPAGSRRRRPPMSEPRRRRRCACNDANS